MNQILWFSVIITWDGFMWWSPRSHLCKGARKRENRRRPRRITMLPQNATVAPSRHRMGARRRGQSSVGTVSFWTVFSTGVRGKASTAGRPRVTQTSSNQLCLHRQTQDKSTTQEFIQDVTEWWNSQVQTYWPLSDCVCFPFAFCPYLSFHLSLTHKAFQWGQR